MGRLLILIVAFWQFPGIAHRIDEADDPGTITTDRPHWILPVAVDPAQAATLDHLVLFLSTDRGKTWKAVAKGPPTQRHFSFDAPRDGLYWFSVQTVSKDGSAVPMNVSNMPPMLRVRVTSKQQATSKREPLPAHDKAAPEDNPVKQLRQEVQQLRSQVQRLERRLAEVERRKGTKPSDKD
jgi:hypothetical protein